MNEHSARLCSSWILLVGSYLIAIVLLKSEPATAIQETQNSVNVPPRLDTQGKAIETPISGSVTSNRIVESELFRAAADAREAAMEARTATRNVEASMALILKKSDDFSLAVAICALATAVWSSYLSRKHNRLSVVPRLKLAYRFRHAVSFYGVRIVNSGLGPAWVTSEELLVDGAPMPRSHQGWMDALRTVGLNPDDWAMTRILVGTVIRPDEELWIFRTNTLPDSANTIIRSFNRIELQVSYSSLYNEPQPPFRKPLASLDMLIGENEEIHHQQSKVIGTD